MRLKWIALILAFAAQAYAWNLRALGEFHRPDPFGEIVASDRPGAVWLQHVQLAAAGGGYVSFHLVATSPTPGEAQLSLDMPFPVDLYREWQHRDAADGRYYPDALIPVAAPHKVRIPDPENRIPGQKAESFWVDVWIPAATRPGVYRGKATVSGQGISPPVSIEISVLSLTIPGEDPITVDANSYGTGWLSEQYPKSLAELGHSAGGEDRLLDLIHAYHRIFYDHRGAFHQLGYGHAGKVSPEFAPLLAGSGAKKHVASWDLFDRHYGPLLDGSAFRGSRRGSRPIPYMYLPVNPEWPADFLWWGEPGYETEFTNVMAEMERHFRANNWTHTYLEVFFNHKKRYKGFPWDGDEIRFDRDNEYLRKYGDMLAKAIPADSPVRFIMRADTSWTMAHQFQQLKGIVSMWVAGEGVLSWYPQAAREVTTRGDILWTYGGTPPVTDVSTATTLNPLRSWITGVSGFVRWQTVQPGPDPWFHFGGGGEALVYSGERFGLEQPLASIRLKLQRNCLQDIALLDRAARAGSSANVRAAVAERFNGTRLEDWWNPHPALLSRPVLGWTNADIEETQRPYQARFQNLDATAWDRVRALALTAGGDRQ